MTQVLAPCAGRVVPIAEVPDPVFAGEMVGPGVAVDPGEGRQTVVSPIGGKIVKLHPHAFVVLADDGVGVLVHLGIDTVHMDGDGFTLIASERDRVKAGDEIVTWDPEYVEHTGRSAMCAVVVLDCPYDAQALKDYGTAVEAAEPLFHIDC